MSSNNSSWFRKLVFLAIILFFYYDISRNGGLARSQTGKTLQHFGLLRNVQIGLVKIRPYTTWTATQYNKYLAPIDPYVQVGIKKFDDTLDFVVVKTEFHTREYRKNFVPFVTHVYQKQVLPTATRVFKAIQTNLESVVQWLETNVFVGDYSIDNLKIAFRLTLERTFNYCQKTIHWASKQIESYLK